MNLSLAKNQKFIDKRLGEKFVLLYYTYLRNFLLSDRILYILQDKGILNEKVL